MKVIDLKKWRVNVRCSGAGNNVKGCESILEVEVADVFHTRNGSRYYATIECIVCGAWTDLSGDTTPPGKPLKDLPDHRTWKEGQRWRNAPVTKV